MTDTLAHMEITWEQSDCNLNTNSTAPCTNDFVEIQNPEDEDIQFISEKPGVVEKPYTLIKRLVKRVNPMEKCLRTEQEKTLEINSRQMYTPHMPSFEGVDFN